ncbi:MIT domain-containing protein 1-like [Toxorhynchites rutilus septentrionalis]|uniref:MIT domain-containing protein 1-like n=1 Tax=Toxorhynchites rutilus septentrionalis TaxID=329112 RepID=UPI002478DB9B|nr:MIT domain-containing protein 1-like [Toxorhynchites rutilus septentrionalis]
MAQIAITLLTKAIEYDMNGRKLESLKLYEDGIEALLKESKAETDPKRKQHFQNKILEYMNHAEKVKELISRWKSRGEIRDQIHVVDGATGYSYHRVFGKYLSEEVKEILIEEPYVREHHQICNVVMFCELAVSSCRGLKFIKLLTVREQKNNDEQGRAFQTLRESLKKHGIELLVEYSAHMHDRQIMLSNGYVVKIGRGLNYFKPTPSKYCLGAFNYHYRECRETNIDVFYCPENNKT